MLGARGRGFNRHRMGNSGGARDRIAHTSAHTADFPIEPSGVERAAKGPTPPGGDDGRFVRTSKTLPLGFVTTSVRAWLKDGAEASTVSPDGTPAAPLTPSTQESPRAPR